jgi:hypothetical protein
MTHKNLLDDHYEALMEFFQRKILDCAQVLAELVYTKKFSIAWEDFHPRASGSE